MKRPLVLLAAAGAVALAALPVSAADRSYPVGAFTKLRVEGPYTVRVHTGARASVAARGPQNRLDKLTVEQRGDTLVVSTVKGWSWSGWSWGKQDNVYIDIGVPMLSGAALTGSGDVTVDAVKGASFAASVTGSGDLAIGSVQAGSLVATVTGSGDLTVSGRAHKADATVSGSGNLHAGGLSVGLLGATVTGSGDIAVGPTQAANARVTGSGDISIAGHPRCTTRKTGSGDISCGG